MLLKMGYQQEEFFCNLSLYLINKTIEAFKLFPIQHFKLTKRLDSPVFIGYF